MTQCQHVCETGDQCSKEAHQQLCGVWFCHDHLEEITNKPGAVSRLYLVRGGSLSRSESKR